MRPTKTRLTGGRRGPRTWVAAITSGLAAAALLVPATASMTLVPASTAEAAAPTTLTLSWVSFSTTWRRVWGWSIDKSGPSEVLLSPGEPYNIPYKVTVEGTKTDPTSGDAVARLNSANVRIQNNTGTTATITGVSFVADPAVPALVVDYCGTSGYPTHEPVPTPDAPKVLPSGSTWFCHGTVGSGIVPGPLTPHQVTATVTTTGTPPGGSATGTATWATTPTQQWYDDIRVSDTIGGVTTQLGEADAQTATSKTFEFLGPVVKYDTKGTYSVEDVAGFLSFGDVAESNPKPITGTDSHSVRVVVFGCTLTQGYWKTHADPSLGEKYDANWANLPGGQNTPFLNSGWSYIEVLNTPPKGGNAYFILAHQYIAAELNGLDDAGMPQAVLDDVNAAKTLLTAAGASRSIDAASRADAQALAKALESYNMGQRGPAHCTE